jgi:hypothetical protein
MTMTEHTEALSLSFSIDDARAAFRGIEVGDLLLALLARLPPPPHWEGCLVYRSESAPDSVRIGFVGPGAGEVRQQLAQGLEGVGVPVLALETHAEAVVLTAVARVRAGRWDGVS